MAISVRIADAESPQTILRASQLQTGSDVIFIAQKIAEIEVNIIGINLIYQASIIAISNVHHLFFNMLI
jgi:hypothetical protein